MDSFPCLVVLYSLVLINGIVACLILLLRAQRCLELDGLAI